MSYKITGDELPVPAAAGGYQSSVRANSPAILHAIARICNYFLTGRRPPSSQKAGGKLRAYHEHDFEALLAVLHQNHRKLKIDPDARAIQGAMKREFNQSIAKLTPLMQRIAATDRLIDLIVYRLYGLTEEEIATVEGSVSGTMSNAGGGGEE